MSYSHHLLTIQIDTKSLEQRPMVLLGQQPGKRYFFDAVGLLDSLEYTYTLEQGAFSTLSQAKKL